MDTASRILDFFCIVSRLIGSQESNLARSVSFKCSILIELRRVSDSANYGGNGVPTERQQDGYIHTVWSIVYGVLCIHEVMSNSASAYSTVLYKEMAPSIAFACKYQYPAMDLYKVMYHRGGRI